MINKYQTSLRSKCRFRGVGLHSGLATEITLNPSQNDSGIRFVLLNAANPNKTNPNKTDQNKTNPNKIDPKTNHVKPPSCPDDLHKSNSLVASWQNISNTDLNTTLTSEAGTVQTVEHLLSALAGMEVSNVLIEVRGGEIPAMDGSARPFVEGIARAGRVRGEPLRYLKVLQAVEVSKGDTVAGLYPSTEPIYDCGIAFPQASIGSQRVRVRMSAERYAAEIAASRTFGFEAQLKKLRSSGRALGAGLHNAIGLATDGTVLNDEGLRFPDELVRHKLLDAVGDLSLSGGRLLAEYRAFKPSHAIHQQLLKALFADKSQYQWMVGNQKL